MILWRAYYADGTRIGSDEASWQEIPQEGLVGVVVFLDYPYRRIIDGHDWVWLENGELHYVDSHDEWGKWAPKPVVQCAACLKQGVGMEDEAWERVQIEMAEDKEWPNI